MKVIVIGGGVSGLVFSVMSARLGNDVTLLEANQRVGKKLLLTGGGRCNITNACVDGTKYNNPTFVSKVLQKCSRKKFVAFLESCGIYLSDGDDEGRIYPITYSAASVCDCLRFSAMRDGVNIICNAFVTKIQKNQKGYQVCFGDKSLFCDRVVVAVGGRSQSNIFALDKLIKKEYLTDMMPSLAPMKVSFLPKSLSGVRTKCLLSLKMGGDTIAKETGELQFRDFGLSGICTLNISSYVARSRASGNLKQFDVAVDFLPEFSEEKIVEILLTRKKQGYGEQNLLVGLLPNKIAEWLQKSSNGKIAQLAYQIKNTVFYDANPVDYSLSQVTAGGVDVSFLDDSFTLPNGVTVIGEALDVDGLCGGYNLHFAIVSAIVSAEEIQKQEKK